MGILAFLKHKPSSVASAPEAEAMNVFISSELVAEAKKNAVKNLPVLKNSSGEWESLLGETGLAEEVGKFGASGTEKENTFEKHILVTIFFNTKAEAKVGKLTVEVKSGAETKTYPEIKTIGTTTGVMTSSFSFFLKPKDKFKLTYSEGITEEPLWWKQVV